MPATTSLMSLSCTYPGSFGFQQKGLFLIENITKNITCLVLESIYTQALHCLAMKFQ
jgi:hypothetical protein